MGRKIEEYVGGIGLETQNAFMERKMISVWRVLRNDKTCGANCPWLFLFPLNHKRIKGGELLYSLLSGKRALNSILSSVGVELVFSF